MYSNIEYYSSLAYRDHFDLGIEKQIGLSCYFFKILFESPIFVNLKNSIKCMFKWNRIPADRR